MSFDLMDIKWAIEDSYDIKLKVRENPIKPGTKELFWETKHDEINIHISHYTAKDREGQEFISCGYDHHKGEDLHGHGSPCDTLEDVFRFFDYIKIFPKREHKDDYQQLKLF